MKKAILIFIVTLLFTGCLEEEWDDCNSVLMLSFEHKDGFNNTIGNDVYAYLYKNDRLHQTVRIPYEEIKDGKKYALRKTFTGQLSIAAWAVPKSASEEDIPAENKYREFSTAVIGHETRSDVASYYSSLPNLYLGTIDEHVSVLDTTQHIVTMKNTVCRVNVSIESGILDSYISSGTPTVQLAGISRESNLFHRPLGEEIVVLADLVKNSTEYTSSAGLMPSYEINDTDEGKKNVIVTVYCGEREIFSVDTERKSVADEVIDVVVQGTIVEIWVDGWRVKTANLKL